jgi:hypothetical protein
MGNFFSNVDNKIKKENDTTIIKFIDNKNNQEIGHINYSLCPPADNNDIEIIEEDEMNINTKIKTTILDVMKEENKRKIHINFIKIEKNYKGLGGSYFILKEFIENLNDCDITNFYITLSDDTDKNEGEFNYWENFGAVIYTNDDEAIIYDTDSFIKYIDKKSKKYEKIIISKLKCPMACKKRKAKNIQKQNGGKNSQYIMTKQGKRKIHVGKKGGKYYIMNKKKVYVK